MKMNRFNPIRELARSERWQSLYSRAKELNINLFNNTTDLSRIQVVFLNYLELYNSMYSNLASGDELLDEDVINDDILTDAYLEYKKHERRNKDKPKRKRNNTSSPSVVFTRKGDE